MHQAENDPPFNISVTRTQREGSNAAFDTLIAREDRRQHGPGKRDSIAESPTSIDADCNRRHGPLAGLAAGGGSGIGSVQVGGLRFRMSADLTRITRQVFALPPFQAAPFLLF